MAKRTIVDAHHHLWDLHERDYPWLGGPPFMSSVAGDVSPIATSYLIDDYLADTSGYDVRKTVHVDGGCSDFLGETTWLAETSSSRGLPNAIVANTRLQNASIGEALERQASVPQVRGVRQILNWDPDPLLTFTDRPDYMTDSRWLDGYRLLSAHGLSFDLQVYPWQLAEAAKLAARFPDTLIILNHAGMPFHQSGKGLESWRNGMRLLAERDNASVKISGLGMVDWGWATSSIRPLVLETIDVFGTDRCMFASNFPVDKLYSSFSTLFGAFEEIVSQFSDTEQHKLFAANAERFYRI